MKNKILISILSVLSILLFSPIVFSQDTVMRIEHSSVTPSDVGDIFSVNIVIEHGQNVTGCQVWLTYNPTVLKYADFEKGRFFPDDAFYGKMQFGELHSTKTRLRFPIVTFPPSQHSGDGTIITLYFEVLDVTTSYLLNLVEGDLSSGTGTLLSDVDRNLLLPHVDDHGNTKAKATRLSLGVDGARLGAIKPNSDVDYFEVKISGPGELRLYTFLGRDVVIELQDSTGSVPANDDIEYGPIEDLRLRHNVNAGIYYIKVTGTTENSTENYRLRANFTPEAVVNHLPRPIVRLIHFIPSGKEYDLAKKHEELKKKMEHVKAFYQCMMRDHGHFTSDVVKTFGKTFIFDEKAYVVHSHFPKDHWQAVWTDPDKDLFSGVWADIEAFWGGENWGDFDATTDIYLAIMEGDYVKGVGGAGLTGKAICYSTDWLTIAHELGHAFGLGHNFGDARYMMSYCNHTWAPRWSEIPWACDDTYDHNPIRDIHGIFSTDHCDDFDFDGREISKETADWLDVHRAFNSPQQLAGNDNSPTIEIIEPANHIYSRGTTFPLVVRYEDKDIPHQIQLYVPLTESEEFAEGLKLHDAITLPGKGTDFEVRFDLSDVMADRDIIKINIYTIDRYGNIATTRGGWGDKIEMGLPAGFTEPLTFIKAERADIDVAIISEILNDREPAKDYADVNGDGEVNIHDLTLVENARKDIGNHPPIVGLIPTVRLIYIYPSDSEAREDVKDTLLGKMEAVQHFYATHLDGKTFQYDKKLLSIQSGITTEGWNNLFKNHFQVAAEHHLLPEVEAKWNAERKPTDPYTPDKDIYLIVIDHVSLGGRRGGAWSKGHGGEAFVTGLSMPWSVIAHELGHTFGLEHQYHDARYVMNHCGTLEDAGPGRDDAGFWKDVGAFVDNILSAGQNLIPFFDTTTLSNSDKHWLDVHPAFTGAMSTSTSKTKLTIVATESRVKVSATDPDGIHQIQLLVPEIKGSFFCQDAKKQGTSDSRKRVKWGTSSGKTNTNFSFNISDLWGDQESIKITFQVIDRLGNITEETDFGYTTITKEDVKGAPTKVEGQQWLRPKETTLLANYPNPFNPETWIPYQLSKPADVTLTIYDIQGRAVRTLALGHQPIGIYHGKSRAAYWDGRNALGERVASGLYFYTLTAGDFSATRKLLIRK